MWIRKVVNIEQKVYYLILVNVGACFSTGHKDAENISLILLALVYPTRVTE